MRYVFSNILVECVLLLFLYNFAHAQKSINSSTQNNAGTSVQGGNYLLNYSVGQPAPNGSFTGGQYNLSAGFLNTIAASVTKLDNISPIITHTAIVSSAINQAIVIQANITDNKDISNATLNFRKGGDTGFTSLIMLPTGNVFNGLIPPDIVQLKGLEYFIETIDSSGNISRKPSQGVYSVSVTVLGEGLQKNTAQPSGNSQNGYRLISLPLSADNKTPSAVFEDDLGSYDNTKWRFFSLQANQIYVEFPNTPLMDPGNAFWLIVNDAGKFIDTGPASSNLTNAPFQISLNAGWNFIGNPFNFPIPVDNLSLANNQNFSIEFYSGSWNPFVGSIQPFEGYALFTENATELLINPALTNSNLAKHLSQENVKSLWEINIVATCQAAMDSTNVIALVPSSSKSWDKHDRPEPPVIGDYISLYFPHDDWDKISKSYSKDARPDIADGDIWDIEVRSNIKDIINLSFENIENLPTNYEIKLIDEKFQMVKDLISSSKFSLTSSNNEAPRKLKLIIGNKEFVNKKIEQIIIAPTTFELSQNYPNPFNPTTAIRYTISNADAIHDLSVQLKIYDLLGKLVATLVDKQQSPGNYEVEFNGNNISSGIYYYQIKIGKFVETRKMILLK